MSDSEATPVPLRVARPRDCDGCTACCTVKGIHAVPSPAFERCRHLCAGVPENDDRAGCGVYEIRPLACEQYACEWARGHAPQWMRPDVCGVVPDHTPGRTAIHLTEVWHDAASAEPIREFIRWANDRQAHVVVTPHPPAGWTPGQPRPRNRIHLFTGEVREFEGGELRGTFVVPRE